MPGIGEYLRQNGLPRTALAIPLLFWLVSSASLAQVPSRSSIYALSRKATEAHGVPGGQLNSSFSNVQYTRAQQDRSLVETGNSATVTTDRQLREAFMTPSITRIEITETLSLTEEGWPPAVNPIRISRNITITSPVGWTGHLPSIWFNALANKLHMAPRVIITLTRIFVHGIRSELLTAAPGFNLFTASDPQLPALWPQVVLADAILVLIKCPPIASLFTTAFVNDLNKARRSIGDTRQQLLRPFSSPGEPICALPHRLPRKCLHALDFAHTVHGIASCAPHQRHTTIHLCQPDLARSLLHISLRQAPPSCLI